MGNVVTQLRQRWTRERFAQQTEQFLAGLYRTARRLTRDPAEAEDLVHDTYLKAFQAFERADVRSEDACRSWLYRILVNAYRDRYRRQQRSPEVQASPGVHERDGNVIEAAISPAPNPEALLGHKHFSDAAHAAIAALSPEVRLAVTLFFVEGFSYKEIAAIADCPLGTVMSRLARGREKLRQQLQPYHDVPYAPPELSQVSVTATPPPSCAIHKGSCTP